MRITKFTLLFAALTVTAMAAPPTWWSNENTRVLDPNVENANNHTVANIGQLKNVSKRAKMHLDTALPGGAGAAISAVVASFEPQEGESYTPEELEIIKRANHAPLILGQLKAVAKPFYDRLLSAGYNTRQSLIEHGYPGNWAFDYPWDPATPVAENYRPANLGQLKMVFSFEVGASDPEEDADGDGLPDWWEIEHNMDPDDADENSNGVPDGLDDFDGDLINNVTEYRTGRNPWAGEIQDVNGTLGLIIHTKLDELE